DQLWAGFYAASSAGSAISPRPAPWRAFSKRAPAPQPGPGPPPRPWPRRDAAHVPTTLSAQSDTTAPTVPDVSHRRRFEIAVDGAVAGFAEYRRRPGVISLTHTEIDPAHKDQGLGTPLVKTALDTARAQG